MADAFNFELVSPERLLVSEKVTEVVIPATLGEMTVMAHHAPAMTTIKPGVVSVKLAGGEVTTGCTLLAESAVKLSDVTRETLQARIDAARKDAEATTDHGHKTKLEEYLAALTNLNGAILPA